MRVLYVYQPGNQRVAGLERRLVERINALGEHHVEFWNWGPDYGVHGNPSLKWARENESFLRAFYAALRQRAERVDAVLIAQTGAITPELMRQLPAPVIYNTADDPDSSETSSFPFVESATVIAHAGVNFSKTARIGEELVRRGAKGAILWPIGFYDEEFPELHDFDAQFLRRDIPVVYVGHLKRGKLETLMRRLPMLRVYSRSLRLKHKLWIFAFTGKWVRPFDGPLRELYWRAQVGVNLHFSYGPSNTRCFQLNAAGVAQVMDCPEGSREFYFPNREILTYESIDAAVDRIEALLYDDALRRDISRRGYLAARARFNRVDTFSAMLNRAAHFI